jgi:hypothetical protein
VESAATRRASTTNGGLGGADSGLGDRLQTGAVAHVVAAIEGGHRLRQILKIAWCAVCAQKALAAKSERSEPAAGLKCNLSQTSYST